MHTILSSFIGIALSLLTVVLGNPSITAAEPPIVDLAFSKNATQVVAISQSGITEYSWPELEPIESTETLAASETVRSYLQTPQTIHFSRFHNQVAIAGGPAGEAGVCVCFSLPNWQLAAYHELHSDSVMAAQWADEGTLLQASMDREISLISNSESPLRLAGHSKGVTALCTVNGEYLISGGVDRTIRVWNLKSRRLERSLNHHAGAITSLAALPKSQNLPLIASASEDRTVRFWQPTIGRLVRFTQLSAEPLRIAWRTKQASDESSHLIAACDDGTVRLIDSQTAKIIKTINVGLPWIFSMAVHPTDDSIVLGGNSGQLIRVRINSNESFPNKK